MKTIMVTIKDGRVENMYSNSDDLYVVVFDLDNNVSTTSKVVVSTGVLHNLIHNTNQQIKEANNEL